MSFSGTSRRLGLPRPSLDSMRTTRKGGPSQHSEVETDYDSYYDEDEVELEAEALLSKKHGEASEAPTGTKADQKKRGTSDQDILDEYKEQEKERKKKTRRKVHHNITPDDLIKPKGLTVVRNGIASRFHGGDGKAKYTNTTKSMAKYSRRLVSAYSDWVDNMTGGLTLYETQWKLRSLGSKTQVKQCLGDMRKVVRDEHVERLLGLEKAERLLRQLEDYYNEEEQDEHVDDIEEHDEHRDNDNRGIEDDVGDNTNPSSPVVTNPYSNNENDTRSADAGATSVAITPTNKTDNKENDPEGDKDIQEKQLEEDPLQRRLRLQKEHRARRHVLEDSDDEEEAVFDDVVSSNPTEENSNAEASDDNDSSTPTRSSITKVARRHVLDDSDDSDDENDGDKRLESIETSDNDTQKIHERADASDKINDDDSSNNTDDELVLDSNVAITSTNTSTDELDGKFERVKNLLEGGEKINESTNEVNNESGETTEAQSSDREINAAGDVEKDGHNHCEANPASAPENIEEQDQAGESPFNEDKTESGVS